MHRSRRRRVTSALIVIPDGKGLLVCTSERVDQGGLANPGRAQQRDSLTGFAPRPQDIDSLGIAGIERLNKNTGRQSAGRRNEGRRGIHGVRLGDNNDRKSAGVVRDREVTLEPCLVEVSVRRRDDEQRVDVGSNELALGTGTRSPALKESEALQAFPDRAGMLVNQDPIANRDAQRRRLGGQVDDRNPFLVRNFDAPALHGHDARRPQAAFRIELRLQTGAPAERL